jgi:acyl-[acyl-carrier-protein]-phospholipid O-acyltransferase/long-chain-fatty-acid--[acyl-carrier-protein] ligase
MTSLKQDHPHDDELNPYASPRVAPTADAAASLAELPPLFRDRSFWGITATQFLGAFNDNVFKQLVLLLAVAAAKQGAAKQGAAQHDLQGVATILFSLPFVIFSGYAGFLSDRYSKTTVIVLSKVAEIVAMLLGVVAFAAFDSTGFTGLLVVLFLMGAQSAFFGPGKYGILPELFREEDLPRANGVILMTTFLAIIFGTASAGLLGDAAGNAAGSTAQLKYASAICVVIAVLGTLTSLLIRKLPQAAPELRFQLSSLAVPPDTRRMLWSDKPLVAALLASCMFWLVGGVAMQGVNSLGLVQLGLNKTMTSALTATIGIGIAVGAVLAGKLSHGKASGRVVAWGAWGMVVGLGLMAIYLPGGKHLLGFAGSVPVLGLLGVACGLFAIPVQVFLQSRPPEGQKGRMIAVMNQANFIAILLSGAIYWVFDRVLITTGLPRSPVFALTALLMLPVALFYRPPNGHTPRA